MERQNWYAEGIKARKIRGLVKVKEKEENYQEEEEEWGENHYQEG